MRVGVIGATGTIGRPLVEALAHAHEVVGVARRPPARDARVHWIAADATDGDAIRAALEGVDVVYHLVHSLGSADFEERDRAAARAVADGAAAVGAQQVVYLGGLGEESADLSAHLRSRAETATILASGSIPLTTLRAAMIVGPGSAAFETIRALVERLPVMVCPRWVSVETQPVALADVLAALVAVCGERSTYGETFDLGGPEVMTYRTMMERTARVRGKHPILIEVPFLTPRLSSLWLHLVTPANVSVARPLVEGLRIPTVAHDDRIWGLVGGAAPPSTRQSSWCLFGGGIRAGVVSAVSIIGRPLSSCRIADVLRDEVGVDRDRCSRPFACGGDHLSARVDHVSGGPDTRRARPAGGIDRDEAGVVDIALQGGEQPIGVRHVAPVG